MNQTFGFLPSSHFGNSIYFFPRSIKSSFAETQDIPVKVGSDGSIYNEISSRSVTKVFPSIFTKLYRHIRYIS